MRSIRHPFQAESFITKNFHLTKQSQVNKQIEETIPAIPWGTRAQDACIPNISEEMQWKLERSEMRLDFKASN